MDPAPTPPFEVVETAAGRLYRLPPRQLGALRFLAVTPLVLAVGVAAFIVQFYLTRAAKGPLDEWAWAAFIVTGIGWTRACYSLFSLAAAIWCGRTEIEVADDSAVRSTDRVGWFRVRWVKLQPGAARKLVLAEFTRVRDPANKPITPNPLWTLSVETDHGRKAWIAPAHPREVLAALADELANRLALTALLPAPLADPDTGESLPVVQAAPVPVVVEEPEVPTRDVLEQPPNSCVVLERHPDGVTLTVPPRGIWQACGGLVILGAIFCLLGCAFTLSLIERLLRPNPGRWNGDYIGIVFLCVGVGMLLACVHYGRKRAVLAVVGDRLLTFETGPFGSRRREFRRAGLLDIACGPSNVSVNNKPLPQLRIVPTGKKLPVGLLTGRDEAELLWLATVLRQALGISSVAPECRTSAPRGSNPLKPWK